MNTPLRSVKETMAATPTGVDLDSISDDHTSHASTANFGVISLYTITSLAFLPHSGELSCTDLNRLREQRRFVAAVPLNTFVIKDLLVANRTCNL